MGGRAVMQRGAHGDVERSLPSRGTGDACDV